MHVFIYIDFLMFITSLHNVIPCHKTVVIKAICDRICFTLLFCVLEQYAVLRANYLVSKSVFVSVPCTASLVEYTSSNDRLRA